MPVYNLTILKGLADAPLLVFAGGIAFCLGVDKSFVSDISFEPCTWNLKPGAKK